jgi:hypothetical protein
LVQLYGCYGVRNELATIGAEAAKKIAETEGNAKSTATRAQGKSDAIRIRQTLITPQLLELLRRDNQRAYHDECNGQLPSVEAGEGTGGLCEGGDSIQRA